MTGKIKSALQDKGYGFIIGDEDGNEYFFHSSGVIGAFFSELKAGKRVQFDTVSSPKGKRAENVSLL